MQHNSVIERVNFIILVIGLSFAVQHAAKAQCLDNHDAWSALTVIEKDPDLSAFQKLERLYNLKNAFNKCNLEQDSVYSEILLRIGVFEIRANRNYNKGFDYIEASLRINKSGKKGSSKYLAAVDYFNYAFYYDELGMYTKALNYYDSTITVTSTLPDTTILILYSKLYKANIFFRTGDYQKAVEESTSGIDYVLNKKDSFKLQDFLSQRAQSLYYLNKPTAALSDLNTVIKVAKEQNDLYELASALKIEAYISAKNRKFKIADSLFKEVINTRIKTDVYEQIGNDYIDYGNFFLDSLKDYNKAKKCYEQTIFYGNKAENFIVIARANINIAGIYLQQKKIYEASVYCVKALKNLNLFTGDDIYESISSDKLNMIGDKELMLVLMSYKTEILLDLFVKDKNEKALVACLENALIMDTLITKIRNLQSGNESKLYWRNYTHDFYTDAIEMSYLSRRADLAFYFMEKSRAVLLNDKLNELNASSHLSSIDASNQEHYEIKIVELGQKLSALPDTSKQQDLLQLQLLNTKDSLEQFIKSLEQKYPVYYQYKYADQVPSLQSLQQYLLKNNQNFVHYFFGDTVTYILAITPSGTIFKRLVQSEFEKSRLSNFLQLCANKEMLNNHYASFVELSNSIYKTIFQQLKLPTGRTVICTDNIVIPFEALCTDETGKHFLLDNYSFSYVYSARFLMKQFNNPIAKGNFAGFAPVSFKKSLKVVDLKNAAEALHASASYYKKDKLFTHQNASRNNFFNYVPSYSIVSIFSHAFADTTDNEPVLFMQDATIHLSELQLLKDPSTKLILLSACQTNVGRAATGEGIYSLARGFAAAGIPSVAATLWKADEQTIYFVSEKFNEYLSEGMNKDEALQKAKLYFIQNNSSEKMLPYYWANMILIGNTDAINLTTTNNNYWWWIAGFFLIAGVIMFIRKKNLLHSKIKK